MAPLHLQKLEVGDRVQHPFRVVDRVEKAKKDGEPFVILTLGNATGQIDTEPIWSNQLMQGWADGVQRGTVVQAIGNVARYEANGAAKRQLRLSQPLRLLPTESVSLEDMLPRISRDVRELWDNLDRIRAEMRSATLKRVLGLFFDDDEFRLRFEKTPGSISRHHAKLGGLLLHIYEVTAFARTAAKAQRANVDLVTVGAMLHDVGKVESYDITVGGFQQTPCGRLLGHIVLGSMMLERRLQESVRRSTSGEPVCSDQQLLELQHLILSHHGRLEFGSPVEPMTLEAEIVHWADEASSKTSAMSEALEDPEAFRDGGEFSGRRHWRAERHLWRPTHGWE